MPTSAIRTRVKTGKMIDHKYTYKFDVSKSAITNNELWEPLTHWILTNTTEGTSNLTIKHDYKAWYQIPKTWIFQVQPMSDKTDAYRICM